MPKFNKVHPVSHSSRQMFELVADVEKYPEFLPMCEKLIVRSHHKKGDRERIIADMSVAYKFIRESFTSQVTLDHENLEINVEYIDGPFRYLENKWNFVETGNSSCDIHFAIDYEFKSKALGLLMGTMFELVFSRFTAAFEKRADKIYNQ
ncbi:MAG: type II toxin-antitoxin system RatA family toxin [Rhizobiaceae bacterium]|nr:type II toxin-antitoxin system RatA family toxin [Rhizobiaceae bacterium]